MIRKTLTILSLLGLLLSVGAWGNVRSNVTWVLHCGGCDVDCK